MDFVDIVATVAFFSNLAVFFYKINNVFKAGEEASKQQVFLSTFISIIGWLIMFGFLATTPTVIHAFLFNITTLIAFFNFFLFIAEIFIGFSTAHNERFDPRDERQR